MFYIKVGEMSNDEFAEKNLKDLFADNPPLFLTLNHPTNLM